MSASGPGTFVTVMRRLSDAGRPSKLAICTCCSCGRKDEVTLGESSPGKAAKLFQAKGWSLGRRGAHKDLCPNCLSAKRRDREAKGPDNRTSGQKRRAFLIASGRAEAPTRETVHVSVERVPVNTLMEEVLAPVRDAMRAAAKLPKAEVADSKRASNYSGRGYANNSNAHASARRFLKGIDVPNPKSGVHYRVVKDADDTWSYELIEQPAAPDQPQPEREEKTLTDASTQAVRDEEERLRLADPPRSPLPSDNRRILESLDKHYDQESRRYLKNFSDESVAAELDMPRAWITAVREQFDFGPDRNESSEAEVRKLRAALVEAERASKKLLEMATEADTLVTNLRKSLAGLGVTV